MITRNNLPVFFLAVINLTCGLIHLAFNFFLSQEVNKYTEFMIIENSLISLVFIYSGYSLIQHSDVIQKKSIEFQILWWTTFCITVLFNWGGISTLQMFNGLIPLSESTLLMITGIISLALSIYSRVK